MKRSAKHLKIMFCVFDWITIPIQSALVIGGFRFIYIGFKTSNYPMITAGAAMLIANSFRSTNQRLYRKDEIAEAEAQND